MIWLTWRQFRAQAWAALAALAVIAIAFAVTGPHLAHLYDTSGIATCHAHGDCGLLTGAFASQVKASASYLVLYLLGTGVLYVAPAIIGIFWGAPLIARELEAGTHRLAWNQSVTRTRWLAIKLGLVGLAGLAVAALLSLMLTWWASPIDEVGGFLAGSNRGTASRFSPLLFGARGIIPVGYAAFAFVLGVAAGMLIRRTVPAMALTLVAVAAAEVVMPLWVRPHLIAPVHTISALSLGSIQNEASLQNGSLYLQAPLGSPGAWVYSSQIINTAGHAFGAPARACTYAGKACNAYIISLHLRIQAIYQPASRYWAFQWSETAVFLALAVALAGFCFLWIRRRHLA